MSILRKVVLASVSGLLCYFVFVLYDGGEWPGPLFFSVSGALFAAGVLFPILLRDRFVFYRGLGLIATSSISYWGAIETFDHMLSPMGFPGIRTFLAASLIGAFVALMGARFICPLKSSVALAVVGFPAAIIGGLVFLIMPNDGPALAFAFSTWHCLLAVAIHIAEKWRSRLGVAN